MSRNLYRVQYPLNGQSTTNYVVAETDNAASFFVGVRDGQAAVSTVAKSVASGNYSAATREGSLRCSQDYLGRV